MNQNNGTPPLPPLPRSIRTNIMFGSGHWSVDEDIETVVKDIELFRTPDSRQTLWLTADHRPIAFDRKLVEAFICAWTAKHPDEVVEVVDQPDRVRQLNRR